MLAATIGFVITLLVFLLILTVLVLIHEAGHYFAAKKFGIKVEEFGFGLPPRAWGKKIGETIYSLNWLPIGGFVKLYGEDEAGAGRINTPEEHHKAKHDPDEGRAFYSRSIAQRAIVIVAGVVMNLALAVIIYYVFLGVSSFKTIVPLVGNTPPAFFLANQKFVPKGIGIGEVAANSPAAKAGIKAPSVLLSINGTRITGNKQLIAMIGANKGKETTIVWYSLDTDKYITVRVVPRVHPPKNEGSLGIAFDYNPYSVVILSYDTVTQKILSGFAHTWNMQVYNIDGLRTLFDQSVSEKSIEPISKNIGGPVAIASLVGRIVGVPDSKERILELLNLAGLLSLSLAFFNVLPIPGLDGGRLFFIIIEAIIGKKVNPKVEGYAHMIGMIFLIGLILLITFKDIAQYFH